MQQLKPADHSQRRRYMEWVLEQQAVDGNFSNKIFFSDEAHFKLGEYVNKQYCRIWGFEDLQVIKERPLHPEKVTVWCDLWSEVVIGPYFCENYEGLAVTVKPVGAFFCLLLRNTPWRICGFNKIVPHATQLGRIKVYCKRHFLAA